MVESRRNKTILIIVIILAVIVALGILILQKKNADWKTLSEQYRSNLIGKSFEYVTGYRDEKRDWDIWVEESLYIKNENELVFKRTDYYGVGYWTDSGFKPTTVFEDYPEQTCTYEIKNNPKRDSKGREQFLVVFGVYKAEFCVEKNGEFKINAILKR